MLACRTRGFNCLKNRGICRAVKLHSADFLLLLFQNARCPVVVWHKGSFVWRNVIKRKIKVTVVWRKYLLLFRNGNVQTNVKVICQYTKGTIRVAVVVVIVAVCAIYVMAAKA